MRIEVFTKMIKVFDMKRFAALCALSFAMAVSTVQADEPRRPECVAPSSPGGGFDITCKLLQGGLNDQKLLKSPMRVTYMPGGLGAVAYNVIAGQKKADPGLVTVFSSGSLMNLAQGKFGRFDETAVKWLAALGVDYGLVAVRADSRFKTLDDLVAALKKDPGSVPMGAGGTVGSHGWMRAALLAREIGVDARALRYVPFEGGATHYTALMGGHIDVVFGATSEVAGQVEAGTLRVLAVLADERLPGKLNDIPTAKEQGYNVSWPVIRGFYMGPEVSDEAFAWWQDAFAHLFASEDFSKQVEQRDLYPLAMQGDELDAYVRRQVAEYRQLAKEFGLAN